MEVARYTVAEISLTDDNVVSKVKERAYYRILFALKHPKLKPFWGSRGVPWA